MHHFSRILVAFCLAGAAFAAESAFDEYRAWPAGDNGGVVYEQDFATGDLAVFTSYQGYEIGKWGYNGSPGLRAERKPGEKYGFVSVPIPGLKAGKTYKVSMLCRGENIVVIFINNGIYGMTGGQMAPTTLIGMKTSTTPYGRDPKLNGFPMVIADMISHLDGTAFITRQSVHTAAAVRKAKSAIRKAFEYSEKNIGLSFVEIVSTCNSGWKMSPVDANKWMVENMFRKYPIGDIKDILK